MNEDDIEVETALRKDVEQSIALIVYAMLLFVESIISMCLDPLPTTDIVLLGCVGGAFCQLWGMLGLFNQPFRSGATVTLSVIALVLLWFSVIQWLPPKGDVPTSALAKLLTAVMALATLALLRWFSMAQKKKEDSRSGERAGGDEEWKEADASPRDKPDEDVNDKESGAASK